MKDKNKIAVNLEKALSDANVFVRIGDNAYPAKLRMFETSAGVEFFVEPNWKSGDHRNFPEGYRGTKEIKWNIPTEKKS